MNALGNNSKIIQKQTANIYNRTYKMPMKMENRQPVLKRKVVNPTIKSTFSPGLNKANLPKPPGKVFTVSKENKPAIRPSALQKLEEPQNGRRRALAYCWSKATTDKNKKVYCDGPKGLSGATDQLEKSEARKMRRPHKPVQVNVSYLARPLFHS
jgi:hypothetical protein